MKESFKIIEQNTVVMREMISALKLKEERDNYHMATTTTGNPEEIPEMHVFVVVKSLISSRFVQARRETAVDWHDGSQVS